MVHLAPLPGSPRFAGDMASVIERAVRDTETLDLAGFDAVLVENFGDAPFHGSTVPPITVAAMTAAVSAVRRATAIPVGVNVLRNDGIAAISIAAATGAEFVRVNVLVGTMFTDQGAIEGRAAEIARLRSELASDVEILADVFVKHAVPPVGLTIEQAALDTWHRGGASALIVSGTATGEGVDPSAVTAVREAVPRAPILIGSGATAASIADLLGVADGVIVGSALKDTIDHPIDAGRARAFVEAAA